LRVGKELLPAEYPVQHLVLCPAPRTCTLYVYNFSIVLVCGIRMQRLLRGKEKSAFWEVASFHG
jgi:hypothetical protein